MGKPTLITCATGNVGLETIKELLQMGYDGKIIAGVRDMEKEKTRFQGLDINLVSFDFEKPETFLKALKCNSLVLIFSFE